MSKQNEKGSFKNLPYIMKMLWQADKPLVMLTFSHHLVGNASGLLLGLFLTRTLFRAVEGQGTFEQLVLAVLVICCMHMVVHIVSAIHYNLKRLQIPNVYKHIYGKVIDASAKMEYSQFERPDFYDKFTRALGEAADRGINVLESLSWFAACIIMVIASAFIVADTDPVLLVFLILPIVFSLVFGSKIPKLYYEMDMETTRDNRLRDYSKRVFFEKKYASEVRLYNIREVLLNNHAHAADRVYATVRKYRARLIVYHILVDIMFPIFCTAAPYAYIAWLGRNGAVINLADYLAAAIAAIGFVSHNFLEGVELILDIRKQSLYIDNLREFLDNAPTEDNANSAERGGMPAGSLGDIVFDNVSFTYMGAKTASLRNVSLTVKKGERIAIVGHNGAGKTTLVKLLMGLYPVSDGVVMVGGRNIAEYEPKSYRSQIGTVFQDLQVFALSIAENVLARKPRNDDERRLVETALEKAQFGDVLSELPNGIDTIVSKEFDENGKVLSGGQAQKVAIARIFAKNPDIVILDEPSSALDPIAEYNMYKNMMKISQDKTIIFISHRLSSARIADRIYLLRDGIVAEQGTHDELMRQGGDYSEMFLLQAQNYQDSLPEDMETAEGLA